MGLSGPSSSLSMRARSLSRSSSNGATIPG